VLFNLLIAVVLDQFTDVSRMDGHLVTPAMVADFSDQWAMLDPHAQHAIQRSQLPTLLGRLPPPLGFEGLGMGGAAIASFVDKQLKVPVASDGQAHFVETLVALAKCTYGPSEVESIREAGLRLVAQQLGETFPSLRRMPFSPWDLVCIIRLQRHVRAFLQHCAEKRIELGDEAYQQSRRELRAQIGCDRRELRLRQEREEELKVLSESEWQAGPVAAKLVENLHANVPRLFSRYDLDGSGSINGTRELQQMSVNLAFSLGLQVVMSDMEALLTEAGDFSDGTAWDEDDFKAWFAAKVMIGLCGIIISPAQLRLSKQPEAPCEQLYRPPEVSAVADSPPVDDIDEGARELSNRTGIGVGPRPP